METLARLTVDLGRLDGGKAEHVQCLLEREALGLEDLECLRPAGPLACDLRCELLGDELLVRGSLRLPCVCVCGRCGRDFEAEYAEEDFCETFETAGLEVLDLTESVREGIILALPSYPICKEACKGVCLHCGKDLNAGPCACGQGSGSSPWDALDGLAPEA